MVAKYTRLESADRRWADKVPGDLRLFSSLAMNCHFVVKLMTGRTGELRYS